MSDHARLAPSACSRWVECPGSIALSEKIHEEFPPTADGTPASRRGSYLHFLGELLLKGELALGDLPDVDPFIMDGSHHNPPDQEEIDMLALYMGVVADYEKDLGDGARCGIEVQLRHPTWHSDIWGTADACLVSRDKSRLVLIDLKTGYNGVEAEENYQLLCYAALACGYYKVQPLSVEMVIVQPKANDGLPPVRGWEIDYDTLQMYAAEIKHGGNLALSPEGANIYRPGLKQCQWCPAAGQCKAQAQSQAVADFFDGPPPTALMGDEQLAEMLSQLDEVDQYISQLKKVTFERAMRGVQFDGFKLVNRRTQRKWSDPAEVLGILLASEVPTEVYQETKLKSFTQVLKHKPAAELVSDYVIKPLGELQLVPDSDPREAANPQDDFEGVPVDE